MFASFEKIESCEVDKAARPGLRAFARAIKTFVKFEEEEKKIFVRNFILIIGPAHLLPFVRVAAKSMVTVDRSYRKLLCAARFPLFTFRYNGICNFELFHNEDHYFH